MGRPEEPLERDGTPVREFAFWLRDLRNRAGRTYQQIARATNYGTSTLQAATAGRTLPTLKVTLALVGACGGDEADWRTYWTQIKRAVDTDAPRAMTWPVMPPWAAGVAQARDRIADAAGTGPLPPRPADTDAPDGWYVESFSTLLRLDTAQPEAVEHRLIVATRDGVDELATSINVPRRPGDGGPAHQLEAELQFGGSLELREQPDESYFRHVIRLARPLRAGERHEYRLLLRLPLWQPQAPYYVYVPMRRSDYYDLQVRFHPDRPPQAVWVLSGTPVAVIYERGPAGSCLPPDRYGEVHVEFRDLKVGLGYGVRWEEAHLRQVPGGA